MLLNAQRIVWPVLKEKLIVLTIIDITPACKLVVEIALKERKALEVKLREVEKILKVIEDSNKRFSRLRMNTPLCLLCLKESK